MSKKVFDQIAEGLNEALENPEDHRLIKSAKSARDGRVTEAGIPDDVMEDAKELRREVFTDQWECRHDVDILISLAILAEREDKYCQTDRGPMLWKDIAQECFDKLEWQRSSLNPEWQNVRLAEREACAKIAESFLRGGINYDYESGSANGIAAAIRRR